MKKSMGVGRVLVAVYGVFALSASARAGYQLIREFDQAPIAYLLSAVAAFVYIVATFSLAQPAKYQALSLLAVRFELAGVIIVGLLSILMPELFGHPSVWSGFGVGYGFIPLVLPVLGLIWLRRQSAGTK
jgi:cellobiose-specific phosphotransferase system component IIC